jgi:hypothetical protein
VNIDWGELERRGLISPSPGREEAVKATLASIAARKLAQATPPPKKK